MNLLAHVTLACFLAVVWLTGLKMIPYLRRYSWPGRRHHHKQRLLTLTTWHPQVAHLASDQVVRSTAARFATGTERPSSASDRSTTSSGQHRSTISAQTRTASRSTSAAPAQGNHCAACKVALPHGHPLSFKGDPLCEVCMVNALDDYHPEAIA
jgi:hypothetical protein